MTRFPLLLCLALAATSTSAILVRADRDDAEYLELATRYASSLALDAPDGEGVLIAPRWVLTAAHRARAMREMKPAHRLQIAGRPYEIQAYFIHPESKDGDNDIALLLLREAVDGIGPTPIYRAADEGGKGVVIVGHGPTGVMGAKAGTAPAWDRRKRASINTVERVSERTLELRMKALDEASDLQGALTAGDSGAPAFIENADGLFVAGIAHGSAGEREIYARVSRFAKWIDDTVKAGEAGCSAPGGRCRALKM